MIDEHEKTDQVQAIVVGIMKDLEVDGVEDMTGSSFHITTNQS